jgi:hypothetical protein
VLRFPDSVRNLREPVTQELSDSLLERRWLDAGQQGLAGKRIEFAGLQLTITDVVARIKLMDGRNWLSIARPSQPWLEIGAAPELSSVIVDFIKQGVWHILS